MTSRGAVEGFRAWLIIQGVSADARLALGSADAQATALMTRLRTLAGRYQRPVNSKSREW